MMAELDVFPHNLAVSSPLVVDDVLYATTGNGVDESHINIPSPQAPSFIALDANTGKLVWESNLPGEKIFHGTWSNPTYGVDQGPARRSSSPAATAGSTAFEPKTGKLLWKFNANPPGAKYVLGGRGTANEIIASPVIYDDKVYIGVGQDPEHGEGVGNLWCIDATLDGDITEKGKVWHRGGNDFHRTISTVAIHDGIVYAADLSGFLYALDAKTGAALLEARHPRRGLGLALRGRRQGLHRRRGRRRRRAQGGQDQGGPGRAEHGRLRLLDARAPRTASSTSSPATACSRSRRARRASRPAQGAAASSHAMGSDLESAHPHRSMRYFKI